MKEPDSFPGNSRRNTSSPDTGAFTLPAWLVWASALVFIFAGLGSSGILDNNEGLYAEIPREMLASHDWRMWVIPHLNGLPYMEKPPLLYWLTAMSFGAFGLSEWAARAVPALSALTCVGLLMWFGRRIGHPLAGRFAALSFISGIGVAAMSRVLMFDMLLTALLVAALMHAYLFLRDAETSTAAARRHGSLRCAWSLLALALLDKGFVALVLAGLVVGGYLLARHRRPLTFLRACGAFLEPVSLLLFIAIAAPWHIAASLVEPIFPWFYFINEHVLRFLGRREPHDYYAGPWWYYLPRMGVFLFPWSFLLFGMAGGGAGAKASAKLTSGPAARLESPGDGAAEVFKTASIASDGLGLFVMLAWLLPLLFFSVSSAKANYYLVAVMPFLALHLALALEKRRWLAGRAALWPGLLTALLAVVLGLVLAKRPDAMTQAVVAGMPARSFLLWALGGGAILSALSGIVAARSTRTGLLTYLAPALWTGGALWLVLMAMQPTVSTRELAQALHRDMPERTVYLYRNFEQQSSLPFYLRHPVAVIDPHSNDLFWGNRLRSNDLLVSVEQFGDRLSQGGKVAVVVTERQRADFAPLAAQWRLHEATRTGDLAVYVNGQVKGGVGREGKEVP
jgi:4-amino-4-deoxy-L-arabinose transferase-like glycosyltransferase